jgi:dihydrofolate synthase/folylpolyglutamate synthase
MDYRDAVTYLDSTIQFGIRPGLERIRTLCQKLESPQDSFKTVHIAGTNGKTSTARITSAILSKHGLKIGTYTSPHLVFYMERFLIDGKPITEENFANSLNKIIPFIEEVNRESSEKLTHFEILTALAFNLFAQEKLDCGVIETGMGGRWDATNIIFPQVAVVTNVDLEHTDRLGKTVSKIAWEKAHIIKKGCLAIGGSLNRQALSVVKKRCHEEIVELKIFGTDFSIISAKKTSDETQVISVKGLYGSYDDLFLPLAGEHQAENASVAIAISEAFLKRSLSLEKLRRALKKVTSPGRFEIISRNPLVVLDGAHNPAGILKLAKTLDQTRFNRLVLVLAILEDKDIDEILKIIIPLANLTIVTENHSERCTKANYLAERVSQLTLNFIVQKDLKKALGLAIEEAKKDDLVLATGSLYTVGEAKEYFAQSHANTVTTLR